MKRTAKRATAVVIRHGCLLALLYALGVAHGTTATEAEIADRIVAIVNDDIIVLSELEPLLKPYREQIKSLGYSPEKEREMLFQLRERALDTLVDNKLVDQEVGRSELTVTRQEVDDYIEEVKKQNSFTQEDLEEALAQDGRTLADYRRDLMKDMFRAKLVTQEVRHKIIITHEDVESYYERHSNKYGSRTKYHLRHILLKTLSLISDNRRKEVLAKMESILGELRSGSSFESLAQTYSESPTATMGGDLGVLKLDTLSSQIEAAVAPLKPGEYSGVVETEQGYQIFMLEDIISEPGTPLADVSSEIEEALYNEALEQQHNAWLGKLRKKAQIKIIR